MANPKPQRPPRILKRAQPARPTQARAQANPRPGPSGRGIDVSQWQGRINWPVVRSQGRIDWAYIKASEGTGHIDPRFSYNAAEARKAGVKVGAYHYYRPQMDPASQARLFAQQIKAAGATDLPPAIDVEEAWPGMNPATYAARLRQTLAGVEQLTGQKPVIYTSPGFWGGNVKDPGLENQYGLWLAQWGNKPSALGKFNAIAWQYSSKGTIPGISGRVDLDYGLSGDSTLAQNPAQVGTPPQGGGGVFEPASLPPVGAIPQGGGGVFTPSGLPPITAPSLPPIVPPTLPAAPTLPTAPSAGTGGGTPILETPLGNVSIPEATLEAAKTRTKSLAISGSVLLAGGVLIVIGLVWFARRGAMKAGEWGEQKFKKHVSEAEHALGLSEKAIASGVGQ